MDSQHRHDLETNSLAKFLVESGEKLAPHRQSLILGGIALVAILVIGSMLMGGEPREEPGWQKYTKTMSSRQLGTVEIEELETTAKTFSGTPLSELSQVTWADSRMLDGARQYFRDKAKSKEAVGEAKEVYETLAKSKNAIIASRAEFGLARVTEVEGKHDAALAAYQAIETGPFATLAKARATALEEANSKEQLEWLVTAEAINSGLPAGFGETPAFQPDDVAMPDDESEATEDFNATLDKYLKDSLPDLDDDLMNSLGDDSAESESSEGDSDESSTDEGDPVGTTESTDPETTEPAVTEESSEVETDSAGGEPADESRAEESTETESTEAAEDE